MPDLINRPQHEYEAAERLAVALELQRRKLAALSPIPASRRSEAEWKNDEDEVAAVLAILLLRPWTQAHAGLVDQFGLKIDEQDRAADYRKWSQDVARERAKKIVDGNRAIVTTAAVKSAEAQAKAEAARAAGLRGAGNAAAAAADAADDSLSGISSPSRVARNAVTAVTEAVSGGEHAAAERFNEQQKKEQERMSRLSGSVISTPAGLLVARWRTAGDAKVCKICAPRNGRTVRAIGEPPPGHEGCRCWEEWSLV